ncbi:MAG: Do family serine endopeptidase [Verrucomicrobiae bacterium]|nr:Do family serine endopeptidase [Verrucomicrobiae bacterium]
MKSLLKITTTFAATSALALILIPPVSAREPSAAHPIHDKLSVDPSQPERTGPLAGYSAIVDKVSPSIVSIMTISGAPESALSPFSGLNPYSRRGIPQPAPEMRGLGSGVILTPDGYLVTNNHVVENAREIRVVLPDSRREYKADVVGRDPQTDVAVLKIDAENLPAATLGDSSTLKVGDTVLAIGSPFGLSKTVTSGIASAIGRSDVGIVGYENFIQTDASINPGNSGGALMDNKGRVIGINTAIFSGTGGNVGIGFAIPVNLVTHIVEQLIDTGEIQRGYLGVMLGYLTSDVAKALNAPENGVLVNQVLSGTPAFAAGIKDGDVITALDGTATTELSKLRLEVSNRKPGSIAVFDIVRDGTPTKVSVEIGRLPEEGIAAAGPGAFGSPQVMPSTFIDGLQASDLGASEYREFGIPEDIQGIVVTRVAPGSKAAEAGLQPGEVITEVARQKITNLRDAVAAKSAAKNGTLLLRVANGDGTRFVAVPLI